MKSTAIAIIVGSGIVATAIFLSAPHYTLYPIANSTNPASWKINLQTGDISLCATAAGEGTEAGCSAHLKQF